MYLLALEQAECQLKGAEVTMDISSRKQLILTKIVALHTNSGDPVGSHLLQEYLDNITVSTATLRNEMAQLTAMGLLQQPHTSAGRGIQILPEQPHENNCPQRQGEEEHTGGDLQNGFRSR